MREMLEKFNELTGSPCSLVYEKLPMGDTKQRQPEISMAWRLENRSARVQPEAGLKNIIAYFQNLVLEA